MKRNVLLIAAIVSFALLGCKNSGVSNQLLLGTWNITSDSWDESHMKGEALGEKEYYENDEESYTFNEDGSLILSYGDNESNDEKYTYTLHGDGTLTLHLLYDCNYQIKQLTRKKLILQRNETMTLYDDFGRQLNRVDNEYLVYDKKQ